MNFNVDALISIYVYEDRVWIWWETGTINSNPASYAGRWRNRLNRTMMRKKHKTSDYRIRKQSRSYFVTNEKQIHSFNWMLLRRDAVNTIRVTLWAGMG